MQYIDIYHNSHKIYLHFKAWSQNIYKNAPSIMGFPGGTSDKEPSEKYPPKYEKKCLYLWSL